MDDFEKLINASDLIEWIMETYPDWCVGDVRSIVDHVMDLPSAQPEKVLIAKITLSEEQVREAVERAKNEIVQVLPSAEPDIIRCKDCKYSSDDEYCHCSKVTWWNSENDFCSRAKRRTDA